MINDAHLCVDIHAIAFNNHDGIKNILRIEQDDYPENPRENDGNISHIICWHPRYSLGDKHTFKNTRDMVEHLITQGQCNLGHIPYDELTPVADLMKSLENEHHTVYFQPVWLYDHSGITISCGKRDYPFNDTWDSCQIGWVYITKQDLVVNGIIPVDDDPEKHKHSNWARANEIMRAEIQEYNQYLQNEVYGYILYEQKNGDWEETDSCFGFFGSDIMTNGMADNVPGLRDAICNETYKPVTVNKHVITTYTFDIQE